MVADKKKSGQEGGGVEKNIKEEVVAVDKKETMAGKVSDRKVVVDKEVAQSMMGHGMMGRMHNVGPG